MSLATLIGAACAACAIDAPPTGVSDDLSKQEAAALGKTDGFDYCEYYAWYGDGICDEFCVDPDPDCDEAPTCPDVCGAVCAGEPEPELPAGCPIPQCDCDDGSTCPDVCGAVCAGEPEPESPVGCPIPQCDCG